MGGNIRPRIVILRLPPTCDARQVMSKYVENLNRPSEMSLPSFAVVQPVL